MFRYFTEILFDISERKATEVAVRESEERCGSAGSGATRYVGMGSGNRCAVLDNRHCALFG